MMGSHATLDYCNTVRHVITRLLQPANEHYKQCIQFNITRQSMLMYLYNSTQHWRTCRRFVRIMFGYMAATSKW